MYRIKPPRCRPSPSAHQKVWQIPSEEEALFRNHISRYVRGLGAKSIVRFGPGNKAVLEVAFKAVGYLVRAFVGGSGATTKYFKPLVYAGPPEFKKGVLAGLLEGDGHWSDREQRETLGISSLDLAMFAHRSVRESGTKSTVRRFENDGAGGHRVHLFPRNSETAVAIVSTEEVPSAELVDVSIDHPEELFLLGNGVVTHNCKIGMGYHYRARYELILFFEKGKRRLNDLGVSDVLPFPRVFKGYPAEKPVEINEVLVRQSTAPGDLVIDPFMGSGSAGVAAVRNGRSFRGTDLCQEAVEITKGRLLDAGAVEDERASVDVPGQLGLELSSGGT